MVAYLEEEAQRKDGEAMSGTLGTGQGNSRMALAERGNDLYETPPVATWVLLYADPTVPGRIWEPACGPGMMVRTLRESGREVYATDLVNYETTDQDEYGRDFLVGKYAPMGIDAVVTNPPFKLAQDFAEHALDLFPRVYLFMRLPFLAGCNKGRVKLIDGGYLHQVIVLSRRPPMMHRAGWTGNLSNTGMDFAWFCWNRHYRADTRVRRFDWKTLPKELHPPPAPRKKRDADMASPELGLEDGVGLD